MGFFWAINQVYQKTYNINYSPEDNSLLDDGTGEEDVYEQYMHLGFFEWLLIPNDEVSEEINTVRLITEKNSSRFDAQWIFSMSLVFFKHLITIKSNHW